MGKAFSGLVERLEVDFVLCDVGVRGGIPERWKPFGRSLHVMGFEPDETEVQRLESLQAKELFSASYYNLAVTRGPAEIEIYQTNALVMSSPYPPNMAILEKFSAWAPSLFEVTEVVSVPGTSLDDFFATRTTTMPDFVKLDIQGGELDALMGAEKTLDFALGVEVEVEFQDIYSGQPLFSDIDEYLRSRGFILFDFRTLDYSHRMSWEAWMPSDEGQILSANAVYFRDPCGNPAFPQTKLGTGLVAALAYGKFDFALDILSEMGNRGALSAGEVQEVSKLIRRLAPFAGRAKAYIVAMLKKVLPRPVRMALRRVARIGRPNGARHWRDYLQK